jgi:hypothetical protein
MRNLDAAHAPYAGRDAGVPTDKPLALSFFENASKFPFGVLLKKEI